MSMLHLSKRLWNSLTSTRRGNRPSRASTTRGRSRRASFEALESRNLLSVAPSWLMTLEGDTLNEAVRSVAVASNGDVVVSMNFAQTMDVDPGPATVAFTAAEGGDDIIMARYTSDGDLVWAKHYYSHGWDYANSIALDAVDNIYVAGHFTESIDFNGDGAPELIADSISSIDLFVLKLDGDGNMLWATGASGDEGRSAEGLALDPDNNVLVTGDVGGTAITFGSLSFSGSEIGSAFVSKLDNDGSFLWVNMIHAPSGAFAHDIATDSDGSAYATGWVSNGGGDFGEDANGASVTLPDSGSYLVKYDAAGIPVWASSADEISSGHAVEVDLAGNAYMAGRGGIAKFQPDGTQIGVLEGFLGEDVDLGATGTVYVAGDVVAGATVGGQLILDDGAIVAELDADLNVLWLQRFDGRSLAVAEDANGNVFVGGGYTGTAWFPTGDVVPNAAPTRHDMFLLKWNPDLPSINGKVFADTNGDGLNNDTNRALPEGWVVYLDADGDGQRDAGETFATTSPDGYYGFGNVPAGTYNVTQELPPGWTQTLPSAGNPAAYTVTVSDGDFVEPLYFGSTISTTTATFASADVPKKIKMSQDASPVSILTIPADPSGQQRMVFDVEVNVEFSDPTDNNKWVMMDLIGPDGTVVRLFGRNGFDGTGTGGFNIFSEFDDESTGAAGSFVPVDSLSTFDGLEIAGDWQLQTNISWNGRTPVLDNWSLTITYATAPPEPGPPTIGSLSASPDPVVQGDALTLTANGVSDPDGTVSSVAFYRDADGDGALNEAVDELLGTDTDGSDGFAATVSTTGFALGSHTYFAIATDNDGLTSDAASATGTVVDQPPASGDDIYVAAIDFDTRLRGKGGSKHDERIVLTVRNDADATATDPVLAGVAVTVTVTGPSAFSATLSGVTDSSGVFTSTWLSDLPDGTYTATIDSIILGSFLWNASLGTNVATHDIPQHLSGASAAASVDALDQLMAGLGGTTRSGAADDDSEAVFGSLQDDVAIDLLFG